MTAAAAYLKGLGAIYRRRGGLWLREPEAPLHRLAISNEMELLAQLPWEGVPAVLPDDIALGFLLASRCRKASAGDLGAALKQFGMGVAPLFPAGVDIFDRAATCAELACISTTFGYDIQTGPDSWVTHNVRPFHKGCRGCNLTRLRRMVVSGELKVMATKETR